MKRFCYVVMTTTSSYNTCYHRNRIFIAQTLGGFRVRMFVYEGGREGKREGGKEGGRKRGSEGGMEG